MRQYPETVRSQNHPMTTVRRRLGILLAASLAVLVVLPQPADAQFNRLKERAKQRAKERLTQHAEKKVDQAVDKVVDGAVKFTEDQVNNWVDNIFKGNASVSDDGVLSRDGREDVKLVSNESSPKNADYLSYIEVSTVTIPGFSRGKMTTASDFFLHDFKTSHDDATTRNVIDMGTGVVTLANHEDKTWWQTTLAEMAEMMGQTFDAAKQKMDESDVSSEDMKDADVEMDFQMTVDDTGITENVNGVSAHKYIYTVESTMTGKDEEENEMTTRFYMVTESWMSTDVAGYETLMDFYKKAAESEGMAAMAGTMSEKMQGLGFIDPRIEGSMKKAAEEMAKASGLPVKSTTWMVQLADDAELDVESVLKDEMASADGSQRTVMKTDYYLSNLSGSPFDLANLGAPSEYEQIENPMKAALKSMQN